MSVKTMICLSSFFSFDEEQEDGGVNTRLEAFYDVPTLQKGEKMKKGYLGIDIGSISTKAVLLDEDDNIISSCYLWTEGSPINAVKKMF